MSLAQLERGWLSREVSACRAGVDFLLQRCDYFGERLGAEVALAAVAYGNGAGFGFFCSDHQHVRNFLHLRVANLGGQLFVAIVQMDADAMALKCIGDVLGVVGHLFPDPADFHLPPNQPTPQPPRPLLNPYPESPL